MSTQGMTPATNPTSVGGRRVLVKKLQEGVAIRKWKPLFSKNPSTPPVVEVLLTDGTRYKSSAYYLFLKKAISEEMYQTFIKPFNLNRSF